MGVDLSRVWKRAGFFLGWIVLPLALLVWFAVVVGRGAGVDFDANVWLPAQAVLAGQSPYPPPEVSALVHPTYLYPPLLLGLDLPMSLLPHDMARALFWIIEAGAVIGALRLVGVRDRQVMFWGSLCFPVFYGESLGNPTILLLLPVAAAWRWRDRTWAVGLAVGLAGAFKLILWPLGIWLLATRRLRGAGVAAGCAVLGVVLPWALIGFDGLSDYPSVVNLYEEHNGRPRAQTVATLGHRLGLSWGAGHLLQWACGLGLLVAAVVVARRTDGDRRSFSLALVAALVLSPIVWVQYLALLIVPLAIARPHFGPVWQLVQATWVFLLLPRGDAHTITVDGRVMTSAGYVPTIPRLLFVLGFLGVVALVSGGPPGSHAGSPQRRGRRTSRATRAHAGAPRTSEAGGPRASPSCP
ncbi:MAG: hypothetical protein JWO02_3667 [Solirubrobacterales bacterium]|nr:hypothetical protein [Solirubrobacterales bacterium]